MFSLGRKIQVKIDVDSNGSLFVNRLRPALFNSHHYRSAKKVSFCTVVAPSDTFLLQTLPINLEANHRDRDKIEFVVLVPKQWTQLKEVTEKFNVEIKSSYLKIIEYDRNVRIEELRNLCFQLATGTILSNLETKDYTGNRAGNFIYNELTSTRKDSVLTFRQSWRELSRIALWRDTFYEIGGFDEGKNYQRQCSNLFHRLTQYGVDPLMRSNSYFTKSLIKPRWIFFDWPVNQEIRKLKLTSPEKSKIQII